MPLPLLTPQNDATLPAQRVHRKPPTLVGVPALARHLIFWERKSIRQNRSIETYQLRRKRLQEVDTYLESLYKHLIDRNHFIETPLCDNADMLPLFGTVLDKSTKRPIPRRDTDSDIDNEVVVFSFLWLRSLQTTLRFEFHEEYITLSIVIDLSSRLRPNALEGSNAFETTMFEEIVRSYTELGALLQKRSQDISDHARLHKFIYETVWESFQSDILSFRLFGLNSILNTDALGSKVGDLRRLIIGAPSYREALLDYIPGRAFQPPFSQKPPGKGTLRSYYYTRPQSHSWALAKLKLLWKFIISADQLGGAKKYEFSASRLLDGQVLYVTALGPQPSQNDPTQSKLFPMFSIMYTNTLNPWQIGDLSDRLNRLGTLRVAATIEIHKLWEAGNCIRDIRQSILEAIGSFQAANLDDKRIEPALKKLAKAYLKTEQQFINLTNEVGLDVYIEVSHRKIQ